MNPEYNMKTDILSFACSFRRQLT